MRIRFVFIGILLVTCIKSYSQGLLFEESREILLDSLDVDRGIYIKDSISLLNRLPLTHFQLFNDCVSYSIANSLSIYHFNDLNWDKKNNYYLNSVSPEYISTLIKIDSTGISMTNAISALKDKDIFSLFDIQYPKYYPFTSLLGAQYTNANKMCFNIKKVTNLGANKKMSRKKIQFVLDKLDKPCIVALKITQEFQDAFGVDYYSHLGSHVFLDSKHALLIVGYNDNKIINDHTGGFLLFNSWGKFWGHNGLIWISYKDFETLYLFSWFLDSEIVACDSQTIQNFTKKYTKFSFDISKTDYPKLLN